MISVKDTIEIAVGIITVFVFYCKGLIEYLKVKHLKERIKNLTTDKEKLLKILDDCINNVTKK